MTDNITTLIERLRERIQRGPGHAGEDLDLMKGALSRLTAPPLPEDREKLAKMIEPSYDEAYPPSWGDDKILGNRLARAWAAAMVRGGPVEGIDVQVRRPLLEEIAGLQAENASLHNSVDAVRAEYLQPYMNATSRIIELEAELERDKVTFEGMREEQANVIEKWRTRISEVEAERDAANDRVRGLEAACDGITELLEPTPDELAIGDGYTFAKMKIEKLKTERNDLVAQLHIALASVGHNRGVADAIQAKTIEECAQICDISLDYAWAAKTIRALKEPK